MRFGHVLENVASTSKTATVLVRFLAGAAWTFDKITFSQFCLSGAFQWALLLFWSNNVDNLTFEKDRKEFTFRFCKEKSAFLNSRLVALTFAWIFSPPPPPPQGTSVFIWVRLSSRLHESETPYSKRQICLAKVVKNQRFAFSFAQRVCSYIEHITYILGRTCVV